MSTYTTAQQNYYKKNKTELNKQRVEQNNYFCKLGRYAYNTGVRLPSEKPPKSLVRKKSVFCKNKP